MAIIKQQIPDLEPRGYSQYRGRSVIETGMIWRLARKVEQLDALWHRRQRLKPIVNEMGQSQLASDIGLALQGVGEFYPVERNPSYFAEAVVYQPVKNALTNGGLCLRDQIYAPRETLHVQRLQCSKRATNRLDQQIVVAVERRRVWEAERLRDHTADIGAQCL